MAKKKKKLTGKQKLFCEYYIENWNATSAAKRAGYSKKTAYSIGEENLKKPDIQSYIENIQKDLAKIAGISRLSQLNEFKKIAYSNIAHLHNTWVERKELESLTDEQKACIESIDTKVIMSKTEGEKELSKIEYIKIKLFDKQKALENINKMLGFNEPDKLKVDIEEKPVLRIVNSNE